MVTPSYCGFTVGLVQPGTTTDYVGYDNSGQFIQTNIKGYSNGYSKWDISLDLGMQTISASYLNGFDQTLYTLLTDAPLANTMNDFTELRFASTPGVDNAKIFSLDDFKFAVEQTSVPEPNNNWIFGLFGISGLLSRISWKTLNH